MRFACLMLVVGIAPSVAFSQEPAAAVEGAAPGRFTIGIAVGYDHVTEQETVAVRTTSMPAGWIVGIAADLRRSEFNDGAGKILELDIGGRLPFTRVGLVRPWLGAGVAASQISFAGADPEFGHGTWAGCGVDFQVAPGVIVGLVFHHARLYAEEFGADTGVSYGLSLDAAF